MASITKSNYDNYLLWEKVIGTYTLSELQAYGLPDRTIGSSSNILRGSTESDTLQGETGTDTLIAS